MHTNNGLFAEIEAACKDEVNPIKRRYEVELDLLAWLESFGPEQMRIVGNSIHFDLAWIEHHMPKLHKRFNRQLMDITSLNKAAELFAPSLFAARPRANGRHRALDDAKNSLETLIHYRDNGLFHAPAVTLTRPLDTEDYAQLSYHFRSCAGMHGDRR
jgi:oligoribonuclease